jgi:hypothetical protein
VSKLVSVALDGEVRGQPRALRKKTERVQKAAALLQPSAVALADAGAETGPGTALAAGVPDPAPAATERAAARLTSSPLAAATNSPPAARLERERPGRLLESAEPSSPGDSLAAAPLAEEPRV